MKYLILLLFLHKFGGLATAGIILSVFTLIIISGIVASKIDEVEEKN